MHNQTGDECAERWKTDCEQKAQGIGQIRAERAGDNGDRIKELEMQAAGLEDAHSRITGELGKLKSYAREQRLRELFTYHAPTDEQRKAFEEIRYVARQFASAILSCTPDGADQADALRKVREAVMTANAAIALDGKS